MDFIKLATIIATSLFIIACGGKDNPKEIIFPEHLPQVNPNLNNENPVGIWMSYRVHTTSVNGVYLDQNIKGSIKEVAHEIAIIDHSMRGIYSLPFCTTTEFIERSDQAYEKLTNGYRLIYSGYENGPGTGSTGSLDVNFLNNLKMYGLGHKRTVRSHLEQETVENEVIEFYAVKISDEVNFINSDDITYISTIDTHLGPDSSADPLCIGTYERKIKLHTDDIISYENHDIHISHFNWNATGFDLYTADGYAPDIGLQKLVGGTYWHTDGLYRKTFESQCDTSDEACLLEHKLELNISPINSSGISYDARRESSDESYVDIEVSVTINPIAQSEE